MRHFNQVTLTPAGGTSWDVHRYNYFLGRFEFGSIDAAGQYTVDEDELVEHLRELYRLDAHTPVVVTL